jgi:opacity protein-like surface antigen
MRSFFLAICGIFLLSASATAQSWQGGADFLVGVPQGEFKKNVDKAGFGVTGNIGYAPEGAPVMIGFEIGFMNYGSLDRREPFSTTIPDVFVNVSTTNNFALGHLLLRLQPNTGTFRPYLQGMVGTNYLFTETKIENINVPGQEVASSNNLSDWAFSYGAGAGIMFRVATPEEEGITDVFIDLGARYVFGGEAEYLKEGSVRAVSGRVEYDILRSKTDLVEFQLGVSVRF